MNRIFVITIISLAISSCSQSLFNFTLVSTKTIELSKLSSMTKSTEKVSGEDKARWIIIIPTKTIKIDQAITNTIDAVPGCIALMDGVVYSKFWWIPYIYGEQKFVIEATPLIDPTYSQSLMNLPKYGKVYLDKTGKVDLIEPITEEEYLVEKTKIAQDSKNQNMDL